MLTKHTLTHDPDVIRAIQKLPPLYSTEGQKGDLPAVKIFDPMGQAFWVLWEYDETDAIGYGLCDLGLGFPEVGTVSIREMIDTSNNRPIPFERDAMVTTRFEGYRSRSIDIPDWMEES